MENVNNFQLFKELLNSLRSENIRLIKLLLKSGNINCNDWIGDSGVTIVHLAAGHGAESFSTTLISELINDGADPNVPSLDQMTPVHVAAAWGRVSVLNILLLHGGDPWLQDDEKRNAYNYAFEAKAWSVVELLHNFQLANTASKKRNHVWQLSPTQYLCQNKNNASVKSQSEELNKTYFIENCSDECTLEEVYVSSTEILPSLVKKFVIESQDVNILCEDIKEEQCVNFSQIVKKETNIKCNDSGAMPNLLSQTYTVQKTDSSEVPTHTNLFSELLAAVKRRSDRLDKLQYKSENGETQLTNNVLSSGIAAINIEKNDVAETYIKDVRAPCPEMPKSKVKEISEAESSCHENIGCDVKLLILESDKEDIQVIDISDSGSSFISLTDSEEGTFSSSSSFVSCIGSPESIRFKKNDDGEGDRIRSQLLTYGVNAGPITESTKAVYVRILRRLQERGIMVNPPTTSSPRTGVGESTVSYLNSYCGELEAAVENSSILKEYGSLEAAIRKDFDNQTRTWRGGTSKTSFNYLLLDSRKTRNLPERASKISKPSDVTREFLNAVFYIGKGQGNRPYAHLHEAFQSWQHRAYPKDPKEALILDIWGAGAGVVCLPIFHNTIPAEAFTREAAMIDALGRHHVRNLRRGEYYGEAAYWSDQHKRMLGSFLLLTSKDILLRDGERVLRPCDL